MTATILPSATQSRESASLARPAAEASALTKHFDARPILRGVSFTLAHGKALALLGPNGAGKTTLLRILATLIKPSQGAAAVLGRDVVRDAAEVRTLVGYVGHQPYVYDDLTARENLLFFARMYGLRDGRERASRLLDRVGLRAKADERVGQLSRGQQQRLAIARGILHDPKLLLLDEPDTGLDEPAVALLIELVRERLDAGAAAVLTTHNLERGVSLADDVLVLVRGRVTHAGPGGVAALAAVRESFAQVGR